LAVIICLVIPLAFGHWREAIAGTGALVVLWWLLRRDGMIVNRELSARLAEKVGAKPKGCWLNAWQALQRERELEGGLYVEGWAVTDGDALVIEHGWLEIGGEIVDPSLYDPPARAYFPALRFDRARARAELAANDGELPIAWRFGWGGCESSEYMDARERALEFSGMILS